MPLPKLSLSIAPAAEPDDLLFARQLGVECVYTWVPDAMTNLAALTRLRQTVEAAGLELFNAGNYRIAKNAEIHLALPGRDAAIAEFQEMIRALGAAGIRTTTFTWEASGVWSDPTPGQSRLAKARRVDLDEMRQRPLTHGRVYAEDELWTNFEHFLRAVLPVCEEADVRLALHPNDPPTDQLGGVPCLIASWADYRRAFELANSPYLGMEFCTGCWLEGGDAFGDLLAGVRWCLAEGRIFIVHFRNVSATLPRFTETFLDNGYQDMYLPMRELVAGGYTGTVTLDHTPQMVASKGTGCATAYAIGYMRALRERAAAELVAG